MIADSLEGMAWDLANDNLLKIERPTLQEVRDRVRDGHPQPVWVLKHRLPTHAIGYFRSTEELYLYLDKHYGDR